MKSILSLCQALPVKGIAHITGGGLTENIPRILAHNLVAQLDTHQWHLPRLFSWLQEAGNIETAELYRTFNCGIGLIVVVAAEHKDAALTLLQQAGETVTPIGYIRERNGAEPQTLIR